MSPTDCTAMPVAEPIQVGESPTPPAGWPEAVGALAMDVTEQAQARHLEAHMTDAFRRRTPHTPFPATSNPELRKAIALAREARFVMALAYVEGERRRHAYYKMRDGEELKKARLAAKDAVPFPPELVVPAKVGVKRLTGLTQHFSDGTSQFTDADYDEDPAEHVRLYWSGAARAYYKGDPEAEQRALQLIWGYENAQSVAADAVPLLPEARAHMEAHRPAYDAARKQRMEALEAIWAVCPATYAEAMEKARAVAALDFAQIKTTGLVHYASLGEDYDGIPSDQRALQSLWLDLLRITKEERAHPVDYDSDEEVQKVTAIEWKPMDDTDKITAPRFMKAARTFANDMVFAGRVLGQTKAELVETVRSLEGDANGKPLYVRFAESLADTSIWFGKCAEITRSAECRVMAASAVLACEPEAAA